MLELLVVMALFFAMTAGTIMLLRPKTYTPERLKSERRLEVASLAQALKRYKAATGHFPAEVPTEPTVITFEGGYDLCNSLVPTYLKDIPLDPQTGAKYQYDVQQPQSGPACNDEGVDYLAGYTIAKTNKGGITIAAPVTGKDAISFTVY